MEKAGKSKLRRKNPTGKAEQEEAAKRNRRKFLVIVQQMKVMRRESWPL